MNADYVTKKAIGLLRQLHNYTIGATEFSGGFHKERVDGILFRSDGSTVIETKISRGDFLADFKKEFRGCETKGIGRLRYYACQEGLIKSDELTKKWGLIYVYPNNKRAKMIQGYGGSIKIGETKHPKYGWTCPVYEKHGTRDIDNWYFDKACSEKEYDYLYFLAKRYKEQKFMDNII